MLRVGRDVTNVRVRGRVAQRGRRGIRRRDHRDGAETRERRRHREKARARSHHDEHALAGTHAARVEASHHVRHASVRVAIRERATVPQEERRVRRLRGALRELERGARAGARVNAGETTQARFLVAHRIERVGRALPPRRPNASTPRARISSPRRERARGPTRDRRVLERAPARRRRSSRRSPRAAPPRDRRARESNRRRWATSASSRGFRRRARSDPRAPSRCDTSASGAARRDGAHRARLRDVVRRAHEREDRFPDVRERDRSPVDHESAREHAVVDDEVIEELAQRRARPGDEPFTAEEIADALHDERSRCDRGASARSRCAV